MIPFGRVQYAYVFHELAAGSRVFYHEHCLKQKPKQKQKLNKKNQKYYIK